MVKLNYAEKLKIVRRMKLGESGIKISKEYGYTPRTSYNIFVEIEGQTISEYREVVPQPLFDRPQRVDIPHFVKRYQAQVEELDSDIIMIIIE